MFEDWGNEGAVRHLLRRVRKRRYKPETVRLAMQQQRFQTHPSRWYSGKLMPDEPAGQNHADGTSAVSWLEEKMLRMLLARPEFIRVLR